MQTYPSSNRFYSFFFGVFRSNRLERLRNYMIVMFMKSDFFLPFTQKQLSYFCTDATKILFKIALKNFFVKYLFKKNGRGDKMDCDFSGLLSILSISSIEAPENALFPDSHPPYPKPDQISSLPTMSVMDLYP